MQAAPPLCTRRQFGARAAAAAPVLLGACRKSGSALPILGFGEHRYEAHHDWCEVPDRIRFGNTHAVVRDRQGRVYIFHTVHASSPSGDAMAVFDPEGKFIRSWGEEFAGGAHGALIRQEGSEEFFYLSDIVRNEVVKTTLGGEVILRIGYPPPEAEGYRPGPEVPDGRRYAKDGRVLYSPTNVAVAPNGDIYVADGYGTYFVNRYRSDGTYLDSFGGPGTSPGKLLCPHGIWLDTRDSQPTLVVADRDNHRLQWFSLEGEHVRFAAGVRRPCHFDQLGNLLLVPDLVSEVTLFDRDNKALVHLGAGVADATARRTLGRESFPPGYFVCPHGACFDGDGNIFVSEWVEIGRITKLRRLA